MTVLLKWDIFGSFQTPWIHGNGFRVRRIQAPINFGLILKLILKSLRIFSGKKRVFGVFERIVRKIVIVSVKGIFLAWKEPLASQFWFSFTKLDAGNKREWLLGTQKPRVSLAQHKSLVWQFDTQSPPPEKKKRSQETTRAHDPLRKKSLEILLSPPSLLYSPKFKISRPWGIHFICLWNATQRNFYKQNIVWRNISVCHTK